MIVYLCGAHGVGKTTMVNKLVINKPLIKVVNIDYSDELSNGININNQLIRHNIYFKTLNKLAEQEGLIILDRSPESLRIYDKTHHANKFITREELRKLADDYNENIIKLKNKIKDNHQEVYIYLKAPIELIMSNIKARSRSDKLKESDKNYLRMIIKEYDELFKNKGYVVTINKKEDYEKAVKQVEAIINENTSVQ